MTNPMYMQNPYQNQMYGMEAYPQQKSSSGFGGVVTLGGVGALTGAGVHYFKNRRPIDKSGNAKDEFVKKVFDKNIEKSFSEENKKVMKEIQNVMSGIDKVNSADKLKELLKNNKSVLSNFCDSTALESINESNYKETCKKIKDALSAKHKENLQIMKNNIERCWNKESKKFVKPDNMSDELFKVISKTKNGFNWKKCLKTSGIGALIGAGIAILAKIFLPNNYNN